jgi:hypothetical protein
MNMNKPDETVMDEYVKGVIRELLDADRLIFSINERIQLATFYELRLIGMDVRGLLDKLEEYE